MPAPVRAAFTAAGFQVRPLDHIDRAVGHAMLIRADRGTFVAGSDPRADEGNAGRVRRRSAHWQRQGHLAD